MIWMQVFEPIVVLVLRIYAELCGGMWRYVGVCGVMWRYVELCGVMWKCAEVCTVRVVCVCAVYMLCCTVPVHLAVGRHLYCAEDRGDYSYASRPLASALWMPAPALNPKPLRSDLARGRGKDRDRDRGRDREGCREGHREMGYACMRFNILLCLSLAM